MSIKVSEAEEPAMNIKLAEPKKYLDAVVKFAVLLACLVVISSQGRSCYNEYTHDDAEVEKQKDSIKTEIHLSELRRAERSAEEEQLIKETHQTIKNQKEREKKIIEQPVDDGSSKRVTDYFKKHVLPGSNP
jgi:hypothetical protein